MKRLILLLGLLFILGCSESDVVIFNSELGPVSFDVEVADTSEKRQVGLMNRMEMNVGEGMLFIFPEEDYKTFWMKNTLIELDMIFVSKDWEVVDVIESATPCIEDPCHVFESAKPAMYVIEINGGLSSTLGIKPGVKVDF